MYASTAAIKAAVEKLKMFPGNRENQLLIQARSELTIAANILENRWGIWNSIFWKTSNAATKRTVRAKLEGLAFDALTSVINAGKLLNRYVDELSIADENSYLWCEIIRCLHNAVRWISETYGCTSSCKQLKLPLAI